MGIRMLPAMPVSRTFRPESETVFASFSFAAPTPMRLHFICGKDGIVSGLAVPSDAGEVVAKKVDQAPNAPPGQPGTSSSRVQRSDQQIVQELAAYLDQQAAADQFSGAVLLARDGKVLFEKAYGLADRARQIPNQVTTRFNLGSMNKMFTAVAIMQLAEKGKLAVTDTVGKHLSDYPNQEVAKRVTIHQLLTHTSGLGNYFTPEYFASTKPVEKVRDFLPFFVDQPLAFTPGSRFQYSNAGYVVLGLIIEKVSGQDYYAYVQKHIYEPAGMVHTGHRFDATEQATVAIGYSRHGEPGAGPSKERNATVRRMGSPAGGGYSTVGDLLLFDRALRGHRLLSAPSTQRMTTAEKLRDDGFAYAYGFGNETIHGRRIFGHNGGAPGIGAQFDAYREPGYTMIILSNYDPPDMKPIVDRSRALLSRQ
jgi:CubicO group peptidase (beta-lactamase class C family)